jgi:hypothetical protein
MHRIGVFIAVVAALGGAPSPASAASGVNPIISATVSPTSGWVTTVFSLTVAYHADDGTAARGVTASIAGTTVTLARTSGTASSGTWTGAAASMPPGSWPVTFAADVQHGKDPTLAGPVITVMPLATTRPVAPTSGEPSEPVATIGPQQPTPVDGAPPAATAAPSAAAAPAAPGGTEADAGGASMAAAASPRAATVATPPPAAAVASGATVAAGGASVAAIASSAPSAPPADGAATVTGRLSERLNFWLWPLAGASAAAAALVGLFLLLGAPRSDDDALATEMGAAHAPPSPTANDQATELLVRRTLRHARKRLPDDPIVAALGIGDDAEESPTPAMEPSAASRTRRTTRRD